MSKTLSMRDKQYWANLTADERRELMAIQTAPHRYRMGGYLPDDCGECSYCGSAMMGTGLCPHCRNDWSRLDRKARGQLAAAEAEVTP